MQHSITPAEWLENLEGWLEKAKESKLFSGKDLDRLNRLYRRAKWLESRISVYSGKSPSHDYAEFSALSWLLINFIRDRLKGVEDGI